MNMPDYAQIWREQIRGRIGKGNQYDDPSAAASYDASETIWQDGYYRVSLLPLSGTDTVLDIGCGPGVLAIPMAKRVSSVTALDSSAAMLERLALHCREEKLANITPVHSRWEDTDEEALGMYDYITASYCLFMPDIEAAIIKMDRMARKKVFLYWFCGTTGWEKPAHELMPLINGKTAYEAPKSDLIYGVLSQLGISPEITRMDKYRFDKDFADRESAMTHVRNQLGVVGSEYDSLTSAYIDRNYITIGEGLRYVDTTDFVCISWDAGKLRGIRDEK